MPEPRSQKELDRYRRLLDHQITLDNLMWEERIRDALPSGWNFLEEDIRVGPHRTKTTLRLDTDVIKAFRKTGPGYQQLINAVLRKYLLAVEAGQVKTRREVYG